MERQTGEGAFGYTQGECTGQPRGANNLTRGVGWCTDPNGALDELSAEELFALGESECIALGTCSAAELGTEADCVSAGSCSHAHFEFEAECTAAGTCSNSTASTEDECAALAIPGIWTAAGHTWTSAGNIWTPSDWDPAEWIDVVDWQVAADAFTFE